MRTILSLALCVFLTLLAESVKAQVVIRETVRISSDSVAALEASKVASKTQAVLSDFVSPSDGMLKVHYVKAERQGSALGAGVLLQADVQRSGGPEHHEDAVLYRFPSPWQASNADCADDWSYYGEGPFTYTAPSQPAYVDDAWVFSLSCSSPYAQQTGVCETTNLGDRPSLVVIAWTFLGDEAFERSFLKFDLGGMPSSIDSVAGATLSLTPWSEAPTGDNAFTVSKVAQSWSESAVTWASQPSTTTPSVTVPSGTSPVSATVTPIVQDWIASPSSNYGFGLRLITEQKYRRYYFASSDNTNAALRPRLSVDFSNPDGGSLAAFQVAPVSVGEETTFSYLVDGTPIAPTSQTPATMTIDGVERTGELIGFETGSSCPSDVGYHDRLEVFAYVDTLTTLALEFDRDPETYLPVKGDSIRVTARITPEPPPGSEVVFRLASIDSVRFRDTPLDSLVVSVAGDSAWAWLWSYAYWGVADLTATYQGPDGDVADTAEIPIDVDDDGIADSWELSPEGGGAMNLGGSYQDQEWDEEASPGTSHDGDSFTKLTEYRGYIVGPLGNVMLGAYSRMSAEEKEFFLFNDAELEDEVAYAASEIESQLGLDAIHYQKGAQGVHVFGVPLGQPTSQTVYVRDRSIQSQSQGGLVWVLGQPGPADSLTAGQTEFYVGHPNGALCSVFQEAIRNFWHENSYPESADTLLTWPVPEDYALSTWGMLFNNRDIDGNSGTNDFVNPFDLLNAFPPHGPFKKNDDYDTKIAGHLEIGFRKLVVLHELGHALGMSHDILHPSPMRSGVGPGKTSVFDPEDKERVTLK